MTKRLPGGNEDGGMLKMGEECSEEKLKMGKDCEDGRWTANQLKTDEDCETS